MGMPDGFGGGLVGGPGLREAQRGMMMSDPDDDDDELPHNPGRFFRTPGYAATLKEQWRTSQRQVENLQDRVGKLIQSEGRLRHQLGTVT